MAVFNKSDIVRSARIGIPRDLYTVRCLKSEKGQSAKGFEMSVTDFEIISPESIVAGDGSKVMIAGTKFRVWFLHEPTADWGQDRVAEFAGKIGLSEEAGYVSEVFREEVVGKLIQWILSSEETFQMYGKNDPDPDKAGKFILKPDGSKISSGYRVKAEIVDAVGLAD